VTRAKCPIESLSGGGSMDGKRTYEKYSYYSKNSLQKAPT
jgi:hypothetical protein